MQAEKDLLDLHQGCYKCRIFYAGHFSCTCTGERPTLETCKKVTPAGALHAKAAFKACNATIVSAVFGAGLDEDFVDEDLVDSNEFNEYMTPSPLPPLPKHLWQDCCIDAPFTCAPSLMQALIDHGAFPVLISEYATELYGLKPCKLFNSLTMSTTFVSGQPKPQPVQLMHYCRLNVILPDAHWKSQTLNATICPNLQTDLILRLNFLVRNKIVVDAELCTVIAKESGSDLQDPSDPVKAHMKIPIPPAV